MIAEFDPNPIKKLPMPIIGKLPEINNIPQPLTVINQDMNSASFLPLLSATKGMIMYPIKEPK